MPRRLPWLALLLAGCGHEPARDEVRHVGFRADIPDERRGNASFEDVWWSEDGSVFLTRHHLAGALRVWDREGRLVSRVSAQADASGVLVADGARRRLVARRRWSPSVHHPPLAVFDLDGGAELFAYPDSAEREAALWGRTDDGAAVVIARPGRIEVWSQDAPELLRSAPSPLPEQHFSGRRVILSASYNDRQGWQVSQSGRWLALNRSSAERGAVPAVHLIELGTLATRTLELPREAAGSALESFAFAPDDARLAVGTSGGMWIHDLLDGVWSSFTPGRNRRNAQLGPLAFSADGRRVVALGDQGQLATIDAASGAWLGESETDFDDWESSVRASADGSRAVRYLFVSDVLEVLDGASAQRLGFVCCYFCNVRHNPVAVSFAPSPDGALLAASHRYGAGLWSFDDRLVAPLFDPELPPARER